MYNHPRSSVMRLYIPRRCECQGFLPRVVQSQRILLESRMIMEEQTRPDSEPRPPAHSLNPMIPLSLESYFGPVRHEWLYLHSPKDH